MDLQMFLILHHMHEGQWRAWFDLISQIAPFEWAEKIRANGQKKESK